MPRTQHHYFSPVTQCAYPSLSLFHISVNTGRPPLMMRRFLTSRVRPLSRILIVAVHYCGAAIVAAASHHYYFRFRASFVRGMRPPTTMIDACFDAISGAISTRRRHYYFRASRPAFHTPAFARLDASEPPITYRNAFRMTADKPLLWSVGRREYARRISRLLRHCRRRWTQFRRRVVDDIFSGMQYLFCASL